MPNLPYTCYQRVFENIQSFLLRRIVHHLHRSEIFTQRCKTLLNFRFQNYHLSTDSAPTQIIFFLIRRLPLDAPSKKLRETSEDSLENARSETLHLGAKGIFFWSISLFLIPHLTTNKTTKHALPLRIRRILLRFPVACSMAAICRTCLPASFRCSSS